MVNRHAFPLRFAACLLASLMCVGYASQACGDSGTRLTLPATPRNGLTITLDTRWAGGSGYHPIRVEIATAPSAPSMSQRTFRVELNMIGTTIAEPATVSQYVEIEQGQASGIATILVPQSDTWTRGRLTVYEDGVLLSELSRPLSIQGGVVGQVTEAKPAVVFIARGAPQLDQRARRIADAMNQGSRAETLPAPGKLTTLAGGGAESRGDAGNLQSLASDNHATLRAPSELPESWLAYTSVDLVAITLADWQDLRQRRPKSAQAIERWVRAGGNIAIFDIRLPQERQTFLESLNADISRVTDTTLSDLSFVDRSESPKDRRSNRGQPNSKKTPCIIAEVGMGRALAVDTSFVEATSRIYANVLNEFGANRWRWYRRMGLSNFRYTSDYSNHSIPGVGNPPMLTFLLSITLFVIVIGPVNYLLLKRMRRLYMLLVTVPAGATAVTMGIFLVAILGDGIGVKTLQRSFTDLDQIRQRAATWNRQTYYAGMRPSGGLVFSEETAVFPILNPGVSRLDSEGRTIHWEDGQQTYQNGYLTSRRMEQFLTLHSAATKARLSVTTGATGLSLTNSLGAGVRYLVLTDENGAAYVAKDIADEARVQLTSIDPALALRDLRTIIDNDAPLRRNNPMIVRRNDYRDYQSWQIQRQMQQMDASEQAPISTTSLMEERITRMTLSLPRNGCYYAVLDTCPWSHAGCKSQELELSLHLVRGRWK